MVPNPGTRALRRSHPRAKGQISSYRRLVLAILRRKSTIFRHIDDSEGDGALGSRERSAEVARMEENLTCRSYQLVSWPCRDAPHQPLSLAKNTRNGFKTLKPLRIWRDSRQNP